MYVYKSVAKSRVTNAHHESRSPAGPRRLGTATRMGASLFRRLSVFFESTPGHAGFPKRVEQSEGSEPSPSETPVFRRVGRCVRSFPESRVSVPAFVRESERGPFVREVENRDEKRLGTALVTAVLPTFSRLLIVGGHRELGNICI